MIKNRIILLSLFISFSFVPIMSLYGQRSLIYEEAKQLYDVGEYKKAYKAFEKALDKGYDLALMDIVWFHFEGIPPCKKSVEEGLKIINDFSANNRNLGLGYYILSTLYYEGKYIKQDYDKAAENALKATQKGFAPAYSLLGNFYLNGIGVVANDKMAADICEKGVGAGDISSCNLLGEAYLYGKGRPVDHSKAFSLFRKALEGNVKSAINNMGICYFYGLGVRKNTQKSFDYFQQAIGAGDNKAYYYLGLYYQSIKDYTKSFEYLKKSIDLGAYAYSTDLAYHYAKGWGCEQNFDEAHRLLDIGLNMNPTDMNLWDSKGEFYLMEGEKEKAVAVWKKIEGSNFALMNADKSIFIKAMKSNTMELLPENLVDNDMDLVASVVPNKVDVDISIPKGIGNNEYTFVVIIANESYRRVENVPHANNDGEIFKKYCVSVLGVPEKNIKYVADASLNDLKYNLNWLKQVMDVYRGEAKVIFYYAGHGIPDEAEKTPYLLPVDGYASDITTGYSLKTLYAELGQIPSKSVLVFLDACFSGSKREGDMLASARGVAIKVKETAPKGNMVIFSAAQGDETAYPYKEQRHGMFTYYLLKKLQETKGEATLGEISDYVTSEVRKQSIVINGKMQTPTLTSSSAIGESWRNWKLK